MNLAPTACETFARILTTIWVDDRALDMARRRIFDFGGAAAIGASSAGLGALDGDGDPLILLCAAARASEADDIHTDCCVTPGALVVAVALSLGASLECNDQQVAAAIVSGYEAAVRLGRAIDGANGVYRGIWPTLFVAPVVGAVVAARLSGDADIMAHAIGIAATRISGGSWTPPEPSSRWLALASSLAEGVRCASWARHGLRADLTFLERGLPRALQVEIDSHRLTEDAGETAIISADFKPFCIARQLLSPVEAAIGAAALGTGDLGAILLRIPGQCLAMVDGPNPTADSAIVSAQFQIAVALLHPEALFDRHREQLLNDADVRALMRRISVHADPELTKLYPDRWAAVVEIDRASCRNECRTERPTSARGALPFEAIDLKLAKFGLAKGDRQRLGALASGFGATQRTSSSRALQDHIMTMTRSAIGKPARAEG